jgi:hypothetical protein
MAKALSGYRVYLSSGLHDKHSRDSCTGLPGQAGGQAGDHQISSNTITAINRKAATATVPVTERSNNLHTRIPPPDHSAG